MFVKLTRVNAKQHEKEIVVDTTKIVFVTEMEPYVNYDKPTSWNEETLENGQVLRTPTEWETEPRYIIGFDNGLHPQILDKANYDKLVEILLK